MTQTITNKMFRTAFFSLILISFFVVGNDANAQTAQTLRTWTAVTGQSMEGKFLKMEEETVHLELANGKTARIKLGQLSDADQRFVKAAVLGRSVEEVASANQVIAVTAIRDQTLFIKKDGTLWGAGENNNGQLGVKTVTRDVSTPVLITTDVKDVYHWVNKGFFILKQDNSLWELGNGMDRKTKKIKDNVRGACGWELFVLNNGTLFDRWGKEWDYICDAPQILADSHCTFWQVYADGTLKYVYMSKAGNIEKKYTRYTKIASDVAEFVYGDSNGMVDDYEVRYIAQDRSLVWMKGRGTYGDTTERKVLARNVASVVGGGKGGGYISTDGTLYRKEDGKDFHVDSNVVQAVSYNGVWNSYRLEPIYYVKRDGTFWGWGDMKDMNGRKSESPVQIASDVTKILGHYHSRRLYFVKKDGTLWGDGTEPVQIKLPETPLSVLQGK